MNAKEQAVMNALCEARNRFAKLERLHPDEQPGFRQAIHQAQRIIMTRPVQR